MFDRDSFIISSIVGSIIFKIFLLLIVISIVGVIIYAAIYIGGIILLCFLGVGALIGTVYAFIVYINAFVVACKNAKRVSNRNKVYQFLINWWSIFKTTVVNAFKDSLTISHNALIKASSHKFLSFKKWMWLVCAGATFIVGNICIVGVALIQFMILGSISLAYISYLLVVYIISIIIYMFYSIYYITKEYIYSFAYNNLYKTLNFNRKLKFSEGWRFCKEFFIDHFRLLKNVWKNVLNLCNNNLKQSRRYSFININKYIYSGSVVALCIYASVVTVLSTLWHILVFIIMFLIQIIWIIISKIFK